VGATGRDRHTVRYIPVKIDRRFRGTHPLHLEYGRVSQARSQHEACSFHILPCEAVAIWHGLNKHITILDTTAQNNELFINISAKTSISKSTIMSSTP
jgi:hypothetical protein